jgi:hypothetical protein
MRLHDRQNSQPAGLNRRAAARFEFDRVTLAEAIRRTFATRGTPIPADDPIALTNAYWENPSRPAQMRAFARRAGLAIPEAPGDEIAPLLAQFLAPILQDLRDSETRKGIWPPGGPWRSA